MKKLSTVNWQEMDPTCECFEYLDHETGESGPLFPQRWAQELLAIDLKESVPANIRRLFDVARASMLYGYYYYPLFKHGVNQMHFVAEAAISEKYRQCGGPPLTERGGFIKLFDKLNWLSINSHISESQRIEWDWVREMRNDGAHLTDAQLYPPIPSMSHVEETVKRINELFE